MRTVIVALVAGLASVLPAHGEVAELFGRADAVWDAQVSPDGQHVALGCGPTGAKAVCIYSLVADKKPMVFYPGDDMRVQWFYWGGEDYVVTNVASLETLRTSAGLKQYDVRRAVSYSLETGKNALLMRDLGNWVDLTGLVSTCDRKPGRIMMSVGYRASGDAPTGSRISGIGLGFRSELYEVNLKNGRTRKKPDRAASIAYQLLGTDCEPLVDVIYNDERKTYAIDKSDTRERIFALDDVDVWPMSVLGTTIDASALVVRADYGDTYGMFSMSLADGAMEPITYEGAELGRMGVVCDTFSDAVIGFRSTDDIEEHLYIDQELVDLQALVEGALPGQSARVLSFSRDRGLYTIEAEAPGVPRTFYLYDVAATELSPLGALAPQTEGRALGTVEAVTYEARDGLEIPAYLTLPSGQTRDDGPFPTVLLPHGGPEARDTAAYDWWSQAYAAAGYAVLQPNFRGSAGYGKAFRDAGFGEFGGKMVDDVVDAIAWAEAEGVSDPRGVSVAGASYGGYSALMTALKAPDMRWAVWWQSLR
ncbi:MAG: prolyl oligopeptidase family serine peptidase [Pseudomonadota bacterium]